MDLEIAIYNQHDELCCPAEVTVELPGRLTLSVGRAQLRSGSLSALTVDCNSTYSDKSLGPELAPDAGLLESAEWCGGVERVHVDAVGARSDLGGDLQAVSDVGGPHRTGQPVVGVVGDADRVGLVAST